MLQKFLLPCDWMKWHSGDGGGVLAMIWAALLLSLPCCIFVLQTHFALTYGESDSHHAFPRPESIDIDTLKSAKSYSDSRPTTIDSEINSFDRNPTDTQHTHVEVDLSDGVEEEEDERLLMEWWLSTMNTKHDARKFAGIDTDSATFEPIDASNVDVDEEMHMPDAIDDEPWSRHYDDEF